jgi:CheY-like chemotaxis protein
MDCETTRAENGQVAIDILVDRPADMSFDMVLMDLRMPVMDGLEATRRIRADLMMTDLPIVALTGEMMEGCRAECEGVGFDDYFQKPMKRDKLEELVNNYRDKRGRGRSDGMSGGMGGVGGGRAMVGTTPTLKTTATTTMTCGFSCGAPSSGMLRVGSGMVRTTSGTNVRDLIRRHRSRQSGDNFTFDEDRVSLAPAMVGGGNFDLKRPVENFIIRDGEVVAFDQTTPLSVLIVEDTEVCECTTHDVFFFSNFGPFLMRCAVAFGSPFIRTDFRYAHTYTGAKFLTMQLKRMNCSTKRAENGQVAVDMLRNSSPGTFDLVLMDLRMPVMDGLDATRHIKNKLKMKDLPIVALTGEMIEWCRAECEGIGFDDFFQKPMKKDKLEGLINRYRTARGERVRVHKNDVNNTQATGLLRTTSGTNGDVCIRRNTLQTANKANTHGSVINPMILASAKAGGSLTRRAPSMRRSTSFGQFNGNLILGGQSGPRRVSIDQQLQDPNLKIFTNTVLARSVSGNPAPSELTAKSSCAVPDDLGSLPVRQTG